MSKLLQGQNLMDKAIEMTGSIDALLEMARVNNVSITQDLPIGTEVQATDVLSKKTLMYVQENNIPATRIEQWQDSDTQEQLGIGYMAIEETFIIR